SHQVNMEDSKGLFSVVIGSGARGGANYEDTSNLSDVFNNSLSTQSPTACDSVGSYTPSSGDERILKLIFDAGSGPIAVSQTHKIQSVPFAVHASTLNGYRADEFIQVKDDAGYA